MKVKKVPIIDVRLDPKNARKHGAKNLETIKASLATFGQRKPVVVDKNMVVIAGNGTVTAAKLLGWTAIWVEMSDLEGDDARAYALADNKTAELAEWDDEALTSALRELENFHVDMGTFGFEPHKAHEPTDNGGDTDKPQEWLVVVECTDEADQAELFRQLREEGRKCKLM